MTTINNSENLIEKVGGIEKAREIVEGAPEWAKAYNIKRKSYTGASWFYGEVWLDDLRTAIAEQDSREFKVGDLVVFVNSKSDDEDLYAIEAVLDDGAFLGISHYRQAFSANKIRHATRSEIKAGHRIDDTTDILNHVSPNTKVIDHG